MKIMGYDVFVEELSAIKIDSKKKQIINTINPHSYVIARNDFSFQEALHASDILLPDGSGIVLASKYIRHKQIKKIAGSDLHPHLLQQINKKSGRCFYMGSSKYVLDKIQARLAKECPNIKIGFYSPPYKEQLSEEDNEKILTAISDFNPDVVFIGMTAPKQEKWLYEHKDKIDAQVICSIGAAFEFLCGYSGKIITVLVELALGVATKTFKGTQTVMEKKFRFSHLYFCGICFFAKPVVSLPHIG